MIQPDVSSAAVPESPEASTHARADQPRGRRLAVLSLAALGVVYGDIGTSPLYAIRESFHEGYGLVVEPENVLGVLSCVFWSLILVISVKYLGLILRADNNGEGGILALASLVSPMRAREQSRSGRVLLLMGLFGAALLYGDGMITPAISVLSAVEGLRVATPVFSPYVVPITVVILIGLFWFQRRGTEGVGKVFGPMMVVWFAMLAILGVYQIVRSPGCSSRSVRRTSSASSPRTASARSSCWAPCSSWSPVARRCTPTWGTSAGARSGSRGSASSCRRSS